MGVPPAATDIEWWNQPAVTAAIPTLLGVLFLAIPKTRKWLVKSSKKFWYRHFPGRLNIALAIKTQEGLNSGLYYQEIKRGLLTTIEQLGLARQLRVKDFSGILDFSSQHEAEEYGRKKNIDLVISGSFTGDGLKSNDKPVNELQLRFTYTHPEDNKRRVGRLLSLDIGTKMAQKNYWRIFESNSYEDVRIVTKNLLDMSLYILALTLKVQGRIRQSVLVFERLHDSLVKNGDPFQANLIPHLINCYQLLSTEAYFASRFAESKQYAEKLLALDEANRDALANLAICQQRMGDSQGASTTVSKLQRLYPSSPIAMVDVAFIRVLEGKYADAYELYKRLIKLPANKLDYNPVEVMTFLDENFQISHEPALRYASAITALCHLQDSVIAKRDFTEFIELAAEKKGYKKMIQFAEKQIVAIT
ncbi:MAG: tetratricopeptide repeat protein [Candidatus Uhrbacteria bacterium]